jgi:1-deoxy-D-xylulose-5-phosphate synthase
MGSAILEFMGDNNYQAKITRLGIPDKYLQHGTQAELYKDGYYDKEAMVETAVKMVGKTNESSMTTVG